MADECTDIASKEQFTICVRWVDASLTDHEDVIGLYNIDAINANCLVATIQDVLLRMGLKLSHCRGQCYDGAANMTGVELVLQLNSRLRKVKLYSPIAMGMR